MGKLTVKGLESLKRGTISDGGGLYIRVMPSGSRQWFFRYKKAGKTTWLGLGGYPTVGLSTARMVAAEAKRRVQEGGDPLEDRREVRKEALKAAERTFERVAEMFITAHEPKWRGPKQAPQWRASLKHYAYPIIGDKQVAKLAPEHVLSVLRPIWNIRTETASRIRARIENIWDFASAQGWATGENPARWKGKLQFALPAPEQVRPTEHYPAVPWADLPAIMSKLAKSEGMAARCLRFLTLTVSRSSEARGTRWEEIDAAWTVWTVPSERMKAGKEHRIPLSPAAVAMLKSALLPGITEKPASGLVFPGQAKGKTEKPLSDVALTKALRTAGGGGYTVHGMRSTFRDWAAERTSYPREIAETALAHVNADKVEAAYLRGDHFEKRCRLMQQWAAHAISPVATDGAEIVTLGRKKR